MKIAGRPAAVNAIPTMHNGVQFRSRLEARWAEFFDALMWRCAYEPFDLPGWIPDFALLGAGTKKVSPVLVEVKPVFSFPKDTAAEIDKAYPRCVCDGQNGCECGVDGDRDVLIVGADLFSSDDNFNYLCIGWLRDWAGWEPAPITYQDDVGNLVSVPAWVRSTTA